MQARPGRRRRRPHASPASPPPRRFLSKAGAAGALPGSSGGGAAAPFSSRDMLLRGTAVAAIVAAPSLAAFGIAWSALGDFVAATVAGIAVHLAGMALAGRIYRRLFGGGAGR